MAGGLLVLFLGMYSWNQRTHTLDDIAANVGLEMSGTVLGTFDSVQSSALGAWRRSRVIRAAVRESEPA